MCHSDALGTSLVQPGHNCAASGESSMHWVIEMKLRGPPVVLSDPDVLLSDPDAHINLP